MIEIKHTGKIYTASVHVRRDINVVTGSNTEKGPWVCGEGETPEKALKSMYERIGRFYVMSLEES